MLSARVGLGAVLMILAAGCGGEVPKPAGSTSPPPAGAASPAAGNQEPTGNRATGPAPDRPGETPVASVAPATSPEPKPGSPGDSPAPARPEPASPERPFQLEVDFTLLTFPDFEAFGAEPGTWEPTSEGVKSTGKPRGYLYSKQEYENFTLRLEYRFPRPESLKDDARFKGNTGFLIYGTGEHKLWPVCLEVQGKFVQMGAIKENGGAQPVTATDDDAARQRARRPVGQWNSLEIVSRNGTLDVKLNGTSVSHSEPDFLSAGFIGIQAEDHPFEVRRLRIRRD